MRIEDFLMSQALLHANSRVHDPREKMAQEILNGFRTAASVDAIVRMARYTPHDYRNAELGSMSFMSDLHHLGVFAIPTMSWLEPLAYRLQGKKVLDLMSGRGMISAVLQTLGVDVRKASDEQFTYTHQIHVYSSLSRNETVGRFLKNGVSLGTSGALGDRLFIRIGVQEITRLGYSSDDIVALAKIISNILNEDKDVSADVALLVNSHKNNIEYGYNYDK